jgi:hypothetical protein
MRTEKSLFKFLSQRIKLIIPRGGIMENKKWMAAFALLLLVLTIGCTKQASENQFLTSETARVGQCVLTPGWHAEIVKINDEVATTRDSAGLEREFSLSQLVETTSSKCDDIPATKNPNQP